MTRLSAFNVIISPRRGGFERNSFTLAAKGGRSKTTRSGGGFGAKSEKKVNKKQIVKNVEKKYGGTSAQEIARGTQMQIEKEMKALPPHLQVATQLYQKIQIWEAQLSQMSVLQQAGIPEQEMDGARRAREELERLYEEHQFSESDVHNIFQKITWDASADAKAARSLTGQMSSDIAVRVERACAIVAEAVTDSRDEGGGRCLDVGCGFGVLIPDLVKAGVSASQIYGIDLSPEMIRNAESLHPEANFMSGDFLSLESESLESGFDAVIFCSALHDMPDMEASLNRATSLLRPNGKLVILHAQGASHVQKQVQSNPVLVKRGLPDADELRELSGMRLVVEPAPPSSVPESREGYLAVLQKS